MNLHRVFPFVMLTCLALAGGCGHDPAHDADPDSMPAIDSGDPDSRPVDGGDRCGNGATPQTMPDRFAVALQWDQFDFDREPTHQPDPPHLPGTLYLERQPDDTFAGVLSITDTRGAALAGVTATVADQVLTFAPLSINFRSAGNVIGDVFLQWDGLSIALTDQDGDGVADSGCGSASGTWEQVLGDVADSVPYSNSVLTATVDDEGGKGLMPIPALRNDLIPGDPITIYVNEPVAIADANAAIKFSARVGGSAAAPVAGTLTALNPTSTAYASSFQFQAADFLPFGAAIALSVDGLPDLAGNPMTTTAEPLAVAADPGPFTANPGFESGLGGWIPSSIVDAFTSASYAGVTPTEGATELVLEHGASLGGYLDVAADATSLELSLTILSRFEGTEGVRIKIEVPGAPPEIVLASETGLDEGTPCDCEEYDFQIGPQTVAIDLTPYRGQRVFVVVEARSVWGFGLVIPLAAIVDNVAIK
ncbi:MAG TPA: hypothetical protein VFG83_14475 [Kofleriaceae bacterium]|nr:hypothetical protein [Kofleriaceae bacterium]